MYQYPYGDAQQLNLDWLLDQWKEVKNSIDGSLQGEIDRVEAAITDLLNARDAAVAAAGAANTSAGAAAASAQAAAQDAAIATAQAASARQERINAAQAANNAQTYAGNAQVQATAAANSAGAASTSASQAGASASDAHDDALAAAQDAAAAQAILNSIPPDYMSLSDYAMLTPETFVTRQAYVQNGIAASESREITIDNGVIEFNTLAGRWSGFIINKLNANNEFEAIINTNIASYVPAADLLSDINIIKGCNSLRFFVTQTGASLPKGLFNIIYCTISGSTVTKVGIDSVTPEANGFNTVALTIPETATHYVMVVYQGTSSPTHSDVVLQFSHS